MLGAMKMGFGFWQISIKGREKEGKENVLSMDRLSSKGLYDTVLRRASGISTDGTVVVKETVDPHIVLTRLQVFHSSWIFWTRQCHSAGD